MIVLTRFTIAVIGWSALYNFFVVTIIRRKSAISELDSDDRHEVNHIVYMKEAEAMSSSTEERKAGISEWRRLKRTL